MQNRTVMRQTFELFLSSKYRTSTLSCDMLFFGRILLRWKWNEKMNFAISTASSAAGSAQRATILKQQQQRGVDFGCTLCKYLVWKRENAVLSRIRSEVSPKTFNTAKSHQNLKNQHSWSSSMEKFGNFSIFLQPARDPLVPPCAMRGGIIKGLLTGYGLAHCGYRRYWSNQGRYIAQQFCWALATACWAWSTKGRVLQRASLNVLIGELGLMSEGVSIYLFLVSHWHYNWVLAFSSRLWIQM